jgi:hypothetical protein
MFNLPSFRNAYLCQKPINMRWGDKKLTAMCKESLGVEPTPGVAFLFFNRKKDSLKLFFRDQRGPNDVQKWMPRGGFLLPTSVEGKDFIPIAPTLVPRLFSR